MTAKKNPRWRTLSWEGVRFPDPYEPHGSRLTCDKISLRLPPDAEEAATLWARLEARSKKDGTPNAKTLDKMRNNFRKDLAAMVPELDARKAGDCDFSAMLSKGNLGRQHRKYEKKYADHVAIIDGREEPIGRVTAEGASIFVGRGSAHPLSGRFKRRVRPSNVTINIGSDPTSMRIIRNNKTISDARVVHDPYVDWLATWRDPLNGRMKYVRLASSSEPEQRDERKKHDIVSRIVSKLEKILRVMKRDILSGSLAALTTYLLFITGLRVGSSSIKRRKSQQNDVHGLLTVPYGINMRISPRKSHGEIDLVFDFIGKDSIPFKRRVRVRDQGAARLLLDTFEKERAPCLASKVSVDELGEYLRGLDPGLTPKVLRTTRAFLEFTDSIHHSSLTKNTKNNKTDDMESTKHVLLTGYARVALALNHRNTSVTQRQQTTMKKI